LSIGQPLMEVCLSELFQRIHVIDR